MKLWKNRNQIPEGRLTNITESLPKVKKFIGKSILRAVYQKRALIRLIKNGKFSYFQN